jgi:hypothetical protein
VGEAEGGQPAQAARQCQPAVPPGLQGDRQSQDEEYLTVSGQDEDPVGDEEIGHDRTVTLFWLMLWWRNCITDATSAQYVRL